MNRIITFAIIIMGILLCNACARNSISEELRLFKEQAVVLPDNLLAQNNDSRMSADTTLLNRPYRMIVYFNLGDCKECVLRSLVPVYLFMLENEHRENFGVIFILHTPEIESANAILTNMRFFRTVFYDIDGSFERLNPYLPENEQYRIFLLNAENKIVLAGSFADSEMFRRRYSAELDRLGTL